MEKITTFSAVKGPCAVALGLFDGVHLAHRQVIGEMVAMAKARHLIPTVLTFSLHHSVPRKKAGQKLLMSEELKLEEFASLGVEQVVMPDFDDIRDVEAEDFVIRMLLEQMNAKALVCGYDFRFGKNAAGDVTMLQEYGRRFRVEIKVIPPYDKDGAAVSSTRIRQLLLDGDIREANVLLGKPFSIRTVVERGNHLGNKMGYPTINQPFEEGCLVPLYGVYATVVQVGGARYKGVTNVGVKPTVAKEGQQPLAETFILKFDKQIYNQPVTLSFVRFVRKERKFPNLDELYEEIRRNVRQVEEMDFGELLSQET